MVLAILTTLFGFQQIPPEYAECYRDDDFIVYSQNNDCERVPDYSKRNFFSVKDNVPVIIIFTKKWRLQRLECSMTGPFESNTLVRYQSLDADLDGDIDLKDYVLIEGFNNGQ